MLEDELLFASISPGERASKREEVRIDPLSIDYTYCMEEATGSPGGLSPYLLRGGCTLPLEQIRKNLVDAAVAAGWRGSTAASRSRRSPRLRRRGPGALRDVGRTGHRGVGTRNDRPGDGPPPSLSQHAAEEGALGRSPAFVVDNVDPDDIAGLFQYMDMRSTLVNVVSKSGSTAETMAAYLIVRPPAGAAGAVGRSGAASRVHHRPVQRGAEEDRPLGQGAPVRDPRGRGRSILGAESGGLLPAALLGMDVRGLLAGAAAMLAQFVEADVVANPVYIYAALHFLEDTRFHRRINVMMPYSNRLRDLAGWYRQLWAESLGKAVDRQGHTVHAGLTPIRALGVTDQHSQMQLYVEGPDDKVVTFVRVESFGQEVVIPALQDDDDPLAYLGGRSLGELLNAEQEATAWALARRRRPSMTINMPAVDAPSLGQFFMLLEAATAVAGELYDINAFDQPGVELGKEATYALMGRVGFEDMAAEIRGGVADGERPEGGGPRENKRYLVA